MQQNFDFTRWLHYLEFFLKGIAFILLMFIVVQQFMIESIVSKGLFEDYNNPGAHLRVLKSLQVASKFYASQQKVDPTAFSDFVVDKGAIPVGYTMSLQDKRRFISALKDMNTKKMNVKFVNGTDATYYLTGSDVTADFKGE